MTATPTDADFLAVELGTHEESPCSPAIGIEDEGLRIAAPRRVVAGGRIPICATAQFACDREDIPSSLWSVMSVVVVDTFVPRAAVGLAANPGGTPAPQPPLPADSPIPEPPGRDTSNDIVLTGGTFTEYANFDLLKAVPLPPRPARYDVFITYGPYQSNTVRIEVAPQPPAPEEEEEE